MPTHSDRAVGVQCGAPLRVVLERGRRWSRGAVTCLLRCPTLRPRSVLLLTAGHLFPDWYMTLEVEVWDPSRHDWVCVGELKQNLLDRWPSTPGFALDAAVVQLTPRGVDLARKHPKGPVGPLEGMVEPEDVVDHYVRTYRPTKQELSEITVAEVSNERRVMTRKVRNLNHAVQRPIATEVSVSSPGDSGTLLFTAAGGSRLAVGICSGGAAGRPSIFEPIQPVVRALGTALGGRDVSLWDPTKRT